MGAVSCAGSNADALWENTLHQKSAITGGLGKIPHSIFCELEKKYPKDAKKSLPLFYSLCAIREALANSGWESFNEDDGFILATTTGLVSTWDAPLCQYFRNEITQEELMPTFQKERLGILFDEICEEIQFKGKRQLLTTACSAATHAIALAHLWIRSGKVKRVLVGGIEVISTLTIEGFRSFQLLSTETCTPFNSGRKGINLSDGAAFICLETSPEKALAEVAGVGFSTDAYHMTAPHPEGKGSFTAMKSAVQMAGIQPCEINWVHAHGTGSEHNDLSEGVALERLFEGNTPPVTSTKAIHGHSLATSGALETILCVKALQAQMILANVGLTAPDERIKIQFAKNTEQKELNYILKNTLGFGGANGALVFKRRGAHQ